MPQVKIIMLTVDENDEILFEAVKAGDQGYLLKKLDPEHLYVTLKVVARGEVALSPMMMVKILEEFRRPTTEDGEGDQLIEDLTSRERSPTTRSARG